MLLLYHNLEELPFTAQLLLVRTWNLKSLADQLKEVAPARKNHFPVAGQYTAFLRRKCNGAL